MNIVIECRGFKKSQITSSEVFKRWEQSVGGNAWPGTITILDVDFWDNAIHTLVVKIQHAGQPWPDRAILRSETVDVQVRLTDGRELYHVMVTQWRDTVGRVVLSNPAGGISPGSSPEEAGRREVVEETDLSVNLVAKGDLTPLHPTRCIVTPGVTNEWVHYYLLLIKVDPLTLQSLVAEGNAKTTGVAAEGEQLIVHFIRRQELQQFTLSVRCKNAAVVCA